MHLSPKWSAVAVLLLAGRLVVSAAASATNAVPFIPPGVTVQRDVPYLEAVDPARGVPGRVEKLDLYIPSARDAKARSPAIVIIHGGGWTGGDKAQAREIRIGSTLALAGYVCASVEYKKEGPDRWPTNLQDCKNAVRFLRSNAGKYGVDPENIGVMGGSAGGHLALMVAYTTGTPELSPSGPYPGISDRVKVCVDLYGITDLLTRQATEPDGTPNGKLREAGLFPEKRGENIAKWKLASPVYHVTQTSPPTLILHGMADTTVDREQSIRLAQTLKKAGVEHQLKLIPGVGHTFDLEQWGRRALPEDLRPLVIGFLDKHLKKHADGASPGALGESQPTKFTIAVIPDSQQEVLQEGDTRLTNRLQWLADNRQALNLKIVLHVGDIMNWDTPDHIQYEQASKALEILNTAGIPYAIALGNHDTAAVKVGGSAAPGNVNSNLRITTTFNRYFPSSRFKNLASTYEPGKVDNACHVFEAGGVDWMVLNLELWARTGAVAWAESVLNQYPRHNAIILTHSHLNAKGEIESTKGGYGNNSPEFVFSRLRKHPNVRFVFSGHTGKHAYRSDPGPAGDAIHQFLQCYHDTSNPVRLVQFDPANATAVTSVFCPATGQDKADGSRMTLTNLTWLTSTARPR